MNTVWTHRVPREAHQQAHAAEEALGGQADSDRPSGGQT